MEITSLKAILMDGTTGVPGYVSSVSSTGAYIDIKWIKDNVEFVNFSSSFLVWGILISLNILLMNLPLALKDEKKLDQLYILL